MLIKFDRKFFCCGFYHSVTDICLCKRVAYTTDLFAYEAVPVDFSSFTKTSDV